MNQREGAGAIEFSKEEIHSLDHKLFAGIAWTALARWTAQAISWLSTFYVARILMPGDFGLIAMAVIPIGFARMIEDLGLDTIIVQDRTLASDRVSQLGGIALGLGGVLTLFFLLLAWPISGYFKEEAVAGVVCALSVMFMTDAVQIIPRALLQRDLRYDVLAWLSIMQTTLAAITVAVCATLGMGYWSLVFNTIVSQIVTAVVVVIIRPYRPTWPQEWTVLTQPLLAAWRILVARFAYYGYSKLDATFIGRYMGKDALGVYDFAMTFAAVPMTEVPGMMSKVIPGVFSTVQTSKVALRRYYLMLTELVSYLTVPMAIGLALTADDFVLLVLGSKWESVIQPLQILSLYMVMNSAQFLLGHVLLWTGRFQASMYFSLFALMVLPIGFYIGSSWGVTGVAWAWVIGFPLSVFPSAVYVARIIDMKVWEMFEPVMPALTACSVMAAAVVAVRYGLSPDWHHGLRLAVQAGIGALVYVAAMALLFRVRATRIIALIRLSPKG